MSEFKNILFIIFFGIPFVNNAQIITTVDSVGCYDVGGVAFDSHGNLYFTTFLGNQIKKMDTNYVTSVVAGTGSTGFSGDGGIATDAELDQPSGVAVDTQGNIFFTDNQNQRIRKIDVTTGIISTIAGTGPGGWSTGGFSGDSGPASIAQLNNPSGLCFDKQGNLYIADNLNYRVRKINTEGVINTVAGNGIEGSSGDGLPATSARCYPNDGILVDDSGNLYFTQPTYTIRKVNTTGIISTIAGDTLSNVYNGDGIPATSANMEPDFIAIGENGLLYISDAANNARIRVIDNSDIIHTVAGDGIVGSNGDGGPADSAAINATGLAFDICGNLFFGQINNPRIRKVSFNPLCWPEKVSNVTAQDISIYPNPVTDEININDVKSATNYVLLNITGIIEQTGTLKTGNNLISIPSLPPGMYFLALTDEEGNKTIKKIVKE